MRIALIQPAITPEVNYGAGWKAFSRRPIAPPLGLLMLSSSLEANGYSVRIFDFSLPPYSGDTGRAVRAVCAFSPDAVGITFNTTYFDAASEAARGIKQLLPGVPVIAGGPHVTALPHETLREEECFDIAVAGEGEEVLPEVLDAIGSGRDPCSVQGVSVREQESAARTVEPRIVKDLDRLPFPDYGKVELKQYRNKPFSSTGRYCCPVLTARGCSGQCEFCDPGVSGRRVRAHSAGYAAGMIQMVAEKYGIREFSFNDSSFGSLPERDKLLCEELIRRDLNIRFMCNMRIENAGREMLSVMKRAGCWQVLFGIESARGEVLHRAGKRRSCSGVEKAVNTARSLGLVVRGDFILGLPGDTREGILDTIAFACSLKLNYFVTAFFAPYPGTDIFKKEGLYDSYSGRWGELNCFRVSYLPPGISAGELGELSSLAYRSFYLRPSVGFSHLSRALRSPRLIRNYTAQAFSFADHLKKEALGKCR